jgi:ankyrin repeat protein
MKKFGLAIAIGGAIVGTTALVLASTNPNVSQYEEYALEHFRVYLEENGCNQLPSGLEFLKPNCISFIKSFVDVGSPQLKQLISRNTEHHNYLLFSVFKTELSVPAPIPTPRYRFETIGIFGNFYVFQLEDEQS